ncbi:glutathione S-transferase A6-like [Castor canadensis]|uniref:Glutathione S-transferase A6-like n=1 Tax=Castor canadensis TaxID=51338 RepID=A0AC58NAJ8_CASCN
MLFVPAFGHMIDMYSEGLADLNEMFINYPYYPSEQKEENLALMKEKARNRYFPAFEKVFKSHGQEYLVGNRLSKADVHLAEMVCNMEELDSNILAGFPLLQVLQLARTQQKTQENHEALTEDTEVTKSKMCKRLQRAMFGQGKD